MMMNALFLLLSFVLQTIQAKECIGKNFTDIGFVNSVKNCRPFGLKLSDDCDDPEDVNVDFRVYTNNQADENATVVNSTFAKVNGMLSNNHFTVIITHGYTSGIDQKPYFQRIKDLFFEKMRQKINVVLVDWSKGANTTSYQQAVANTRVVGKRVAKFIENINKTYDIPLARIILNGHSLGAHIMGIAGREVYKTLNAKVLQINGEDPAGPCWDNEEDHINASDARVVRIFHSDSDLYGSRRKAGHYDFYLNNGRTQPGCFSLFGLFNGCDHSRILEVLEVDYEKQNATETCKPIAYQCQSYEEFAAGKCASCEKNGCQVLGYNVQIGEKMLKPERIADEDANATLPYFIRTNTMNDLCQYHFQVIAEYNQTCSCSSWDLSLSSNNTILRVTLNHLNKTHCSALATFSMSSEEKNLEAFTGGQISWNSYWSSSTADSNVQSIDVNYMSNMDESIRKRYSTKLCRDGKNLFYLCSDTDDDYTESPTE